MSAPQPHRQPPGIPAGGQFASKPADDADVELDPVETYEPDAEEDDNLLFTFTDSEDREIEVDYRGDGEYALYCDGELLVEFTSLSDPDDHLSVEEAALRELEDMDGDGKGDGIVRALKPGRGA